MPRVSQGLFAGRNKSGGGEPTSKSSPGGMREAVLARKQASMGTPVSTGAPKSSSGFMSGGKNGGVGAGIRGLGDAARKATTNSGGPSSPMKKSLFAAYGTAAKMATGGKISEYGGKETYKSKAAMMKHEGKESMAMEGKESSMAKKPEMKVRGTGAATKGTKFNR